MSLGRIWVKIHLHKGSLIWLKACGIGGLLFLFAAWLWGFMFSCTSFCGEGGGRDENHCQIQSALNLTKLNKYIYVCSSVYIKCMCA